MNIQMCHLILTFNYESKRKKLNGKVMNNT